ncbi:MAG: hypothetical protein U0841_07410 [Chloroflexia bacterium]
MARRRSPTRHPQDDKVLLPTAAVAPEPVATASLVESAPEGADRVLLPTTAAAEGTGALSIDADGLEEAALLALTPIRSRRIWRSNRRSSGRTWRRGSARCPTSPPSWAWRPRSMAVPMR